VRIVVFSESWTLSRPTRSLPCATGSDIQTIQGWVAKYAQHPNQFVYKGQPLVSTFAGEGCSYGGNLASTWTEFKRGLGGSVRLLPITIPPGYLKILSQVHFVPSLFTDPTLLNTLPFLDGAFNVGLAVCEFSVVIRT
jgi:glucan endo-1,3-alpha-glucosidase